MQLFSMAGMYLIPVVYLPTWVPDIFRPVMYANPFSYLIWCYQDVFYFGRIEHPAAWGIAAACSMVVLVMGFRLFRRLKPIFGNML
jgi:lipopolysaccharide transport system permease protein